MIVYLLTLETSDFSVRLPEGVSPSYISISYHYVCVYVRMYIVSSMQTVSNRSKTTFKST